jgi:hypothetical protein|nr:MAG TPA: hypothetical protein [Caudoviricetes sp.]
MGKLKKLFNANYLHDVPVQCAAVNNKNRAYIDRFVSENYKRLSNQFKAIGSNINSSCFGSMDKLNETLYALYIDPNLNFGCWDEANSYMLNKFTEKELRIPVKKVSKNEELQDSESINE